MAKNRAKKNFNFEAFAVSSIKTIDSIRSRGTEGSKNPIESRINAFYRALGLPAFNPKGTIQLNGPRNNGNWFLEEDNGIELTPAEKASLEVREVPSNLIVPDSVIKSFFDDNRPKAADVAKISTSSKGKASNKPGQRFLFPMVVYGKVGIWPNRRRVSPIFPTPDQAQDDKDTYHRPFIETVISIKLKIDGLFDPSKESINVGDQTVASELQKIGKELIDSLDDAKDNIIDVIEFAVTRLNNARRWSGADIEPTKNNIVAAKPKTFVSLEKPGELDVKIAKQKLDLVAKKARVTIFNFDDKLGETKIRNLTGTLLVNNLFDIVFNVDNIETAISDNRQRLNKHNAALKQSYKELDLAFGTYSGISGLDILAIILALFNLDTGTLISLLNPINRDNLYRQTERKEKDFTGIINTGVALKALEKSVLKILKDIDTKIAITQRNKKVTKQKKSNPKGK